MRSFFHPYLPNGVTGDPLLWVDLLDVGHAVMLDLGDVRSLSSRALLRVDRVVVTHTHMDHFIGFDAMLRILLRRERVLTLTGPAGFLDNVRGKVAGYTWNLIGDYPVRLRVEEIADGLVRSEELSGRDGLVPCRSSERAFEGTVHDADAYGIDVLELDHGIPVLGVALREREGLAVNKDRLDRMGLVPGPWLGELKASERTGGGGGDIEVPTRDGKTERIGRTEIAAEVLMRVPGQQIAYLTDLAPTDDNLERATEFVRGVDLLVCEATFLHEDEALARERSHLTARLTGELARAAGVKALAPFHFSPRYTGSEETLLDEAAAAFGRPVQRLPSML